jgi:putative ABC transport system substrate-binding protein
VTAPRLVVIVSLIVVLFAALLGAAAQPTSSRVPRIGYLAPVAASLLAEGFRRGLREVGYVEGQNVVIVYRSAEGRFDRLPGLAAELVGENVDVIVAQVTQASLAAKNATRTIPIVMLGVGDPVGAGLIQSISRPGGNITGTSGVAVAVVGKSLQLLTEVVPRVSRVAVLWNPANSVFQTQLLRETEAAARTLRVELRLVKARSPGELDSTLRAMSGQDAEAILILSDPVFATHRVRIVELVAKTHLPAMYGIREAAEAGGLMSYGPDYVELGRRGATYVDRILKGAKPADLPVEQPTKFELVVNLRTAKALGLTIPPSVLARADEIIQ